MLLRFRSSLPINGSYSVGPKFSTCTIGMCPWRYSITTRTLPPSRFQSHAKFRIEDLVFNCNPSLSPFQVPEGTGNANSWDLYMKSTEQLENSSVATFPEKTVHVDGTEGWMLLEFCKKLNCTLLVIEGESPANMFLWLHCRLMILPLQTMASNGAQCTTITRVTEVWVELRRGLPRLQLDRCTSGEYSNIFTVVREPSIDSYRYNMYGFMQFSVAMSTSGITGLVPKPK